LRGDAVAVGWRSTESREREREEWAEVWREVLGFYGF
jgi:hypothetical protein